MYVCMYIYVYIVTARPDVPRDKSNRYRLALMRGQ